MTKEYDPQIDGHKLHLHPERVIEWQRKGDCYPIEVEIGPISICNHKCMFCALDYTSKGKAIDSKVMIGALKDMAKYGVKSVMYCGTGEPLLHKDISSFIQKSKEYGLDVALTTNGVYFDKTKIKECLPYLSWIKFSIDSGSRENYSKIHGTKTEDFDILLRNIKDTVKFKKENKLECTVGSQFVMIKQNKGEVIKLIDELRGIEPDYLSIKPYADHPKNSKDLALNITEYKKIKQSLNKIKSPNFKIIFREGTISRIMEKKDYPKCNGIYFTTLIDPKGNIIPCNLFYDSPEFVYGNLYEKSFKKIWKGKKRKEVLEKIKEMGVESCREACTCDEMNKYLNRLEHPLAHDKFL